MNPRSFRLAFGGPLLVIGLIRIAAADTTVWLSNTSGLFTTPSNWSAGMPDSADDSAIFNRGGGVTYTVTFPAGNFPPGPTKYLTGTTVIGPNNVTFVAQTGPTLGDVVYTNTSIILGAPPATPAILNTTIQNLVTTSATVGLGSGQAGTLNVNGGLFQVVGNSADFDLIVGGDGTGTLNVNSVMTLTGAQGNAVLGNTAGVTGTVNVSGANARWSNAAGNTNSPLTVGGFGTGFLNITFGGQVDDFDANIAGETGSSGTVTVSDAGSTWTNHGTTTIGGSGTGLLQVLNGGLVTNNTLIVGRAGNGTMTISGGGRVIDGSASVGETPPTGSGTVNVTDAGSIWTQTTDLRLGSDFTSGGMTAPGTLNITAGGKVLTGRDAFVGSSGKGMVMLIGNGSTWTVDGEMIVDDASQVIVAEGAVLNTARATVHGAVSVDEVPAATWNVSDYLVVASTFTFGTVPPGVISIGDAAHLNSRVAFIGLGRGLGQAFINGAGTQWSNPEEIYVGLDANGEVFLTEAAQVASGPVQLGTSPTGNGLVNVDASNWNSTDRFQVGIAGTGVLTVTNGGVVAAAGGVSVGPRGTIQGNSHVAANVVNGGVVAPGVPDGADQTAALATLHVDGDYTQTAAGELNIQLASLTSFDKLAISGQAALDGTLKLSLFDGFMPVVGSAFQVLTATGGISGTFDVEFVTIGPATGGPGFVAIYSNSDVVLKLINFPPGDYNRNGVVDAADYTVWRDTLGSTTDRRANGDNTGASMGVIDMADYEVWQAHFGESALGAGAGAGSGSLNGASLPEPASFALVLGGALVLAGARAERQR